MVPLIPFGFYNVAAWLLSQTTFGPIVPPRGIESLAAALATPQAARVLTNLYATGEPPQFAHNVRGSLHTEKSELEYNKAVMEAAFPEAELARPDPNSPSAVKFYNEQLREMKRRSHRMPIIHNSPSCIFRKVFMVNDLVILPNGEEAAVTAISPNADPDAPDGEPDDLVEAAGLQWPARELVLSKRGPSPLDRPMVQSDDPESAKKWHHDHVVDSLQYAAPAVKMEVVKANMYGISIAPILVPAFGVVWPEQDSQQGIDALTSPDPLPPGCRQIYYSDVSGREDKNAPAGYIDPHGILHITKEFPK